MLRVNSRIKLGDAAAAHLRRFGNYFISKGFHHLIGKYPSELLKREAELAAKSMNGLASVCQQLMTQQKRFVSYQKQRGNKSDRIWCNIYERFAEFLMKNEALKNDPASRKILQGYLNATESISRSSTGLRTVTKEIEDRLISLNAVKTKTKAIPYIAVDVEKALEPYMKLFGITTTCGLKLVGTKCFKRPNIAMFCGEESVSKLLGVCVVYNGNTPFAQKSHVGIIRNYAQCLRDKKIHYEEAIDRMREIDPELADFLNLHLNKTLVVRYDVESKNLEMGFLDFSMKRIKYAVVLNENIGEVSNSIGDHAAERISDFLLKNSRDSLIAHLAAAEIYQK